MRQNFHQALALTLKYEGGFSNDRYDPGGATMEGVTQYAYNVYRRHKGMSPRSVRNMLPDERDDIYRHLYWDEIDADALPSGVDALAFDIAVNSGPARAREFLAHARSMSVREQVAYLDERRRSFWRSLSTWWRYGRRARTISSRTRATWLKPKLPSRYRRREQNKDVLDLAALVAACFIPAPLAAPVVLLTRSAFPLNASGWPFVNSKMRIIWLLH